MHSLFTSRSETTVFVDLKPEQQLSILDAITETTRPYESLRVWIVCLAFADPLHGGVVTACRSVIAEAAGLTPSNTSTALSQLTGIGALVRINAGTYRINGNASVTNPAGSWFKRGRKAAQCGSGLRSSDG